MVKSVLGTSHSGLRDWLGQRISALIIGIYSFGMIGYFICHPGLTYPEWHYLFSHSWVKILTMLVILSLLLHSWVGIWTILTDYVKPFLLRLIIHIIVLLALMAFFFAGLQILWGF